MSSPAIHEISGLEFTLIKSEQLSIIEPYKRTLKGVQLRFLGLSGRSEWYRQVWIFRRSLSSNGFWCLWATQEFRWNWFWCTVFLPGYTLRYGSKGFQR